MTVTVNFVKAEFHLSPPKLTFLQGANMDVSVIKSNIRLIEESSEGRVQDFVKIAKATGNDAFNTEGTVKSALALTILPPYIVSFEAGPVPFVTSNGNFIATMIDSPGSIVKINDAVNAMVVNGNAITVPTAADNASAVRANLTTELSRLDATITSRLSSVSYVAPDNSSINSISSRLPTVLVNGKMDAIASVAGVPTANDNAAAVRTNLSTELGRIDSAISSRLPTSSYIAPDNTTISAIAGFTDSIESRLPATLVNGKMDSSVAGIPTASENAAAVRTNLSAELGRIDSTVSSSKGLTSDQYTMLIELYRIMGLDPTKPLVVTKTSRQAGSEIHQTISGDDNQATMTRI